MFGTVVRSGLRRYVQADKLIRFRKRRLTKPAIFFQQYTSLL